VADASMSVSKHGKLTRPQERHPMHGEGSAPEVAAVMTGNLAYVVDDNPDIVEMLKSLLEFLGIPAKTFVDPQKAIDAIWLEPVKPTLLVTDYEMGRINGVELIRRCLKANPQLKTMMISGSVAPPKPSECPVRIDCFMAKPFNTAEVMVNVQALLARGVVFSDLTACESSRTK
jgi:CheY-like chemotaxis protein